jgi:hypothetical protein
VPFVCRAEAPDGVITSCRRYEARAPELLGQDNPNPWRRADGSNVILEIGLTISDCWIRDEDFAYGIGESDRDRLAFS